MTTVVEVFGGALINRERLNLVKLIKTFIQSEVESLICESGITSQDDLSSPFWLDNNYYPVIQDREFLYFLRRERNSELFRDRWIETVVFCFKNILRLAENTVRKIFEESVSRHLATHGSQLRTMLDPLKMFPLEIKVNNKIYTTTVEACNVYLHNAKQVTMDSMTLIRDSDLEYSALRVQFNLPIVWSSGYYFL